MFCLNILYSSNRIWSHEKTDRMEIVFSSDSEIGPRCGMALSELALDVELALDLGTGPRSGTNPRSESYIYITPTEQTLHYCPAGA